MDSRVLEWIPGFWSGFQGLGVDSRVLDLDSRGMEWLQGFWSGFHGCGVDSRVFEWLLRLNFQSFAEARSVLLWLQDSRAFGQLPGF